MSGLRAGLESAPRQSFVGLDHECDSLLVELTDVPQVAPVMRRFVDFLQATQRASGMSWPLAADAVRRHDFGKVLATDPMVRRCQWRQAGADPYDIVEPFVMGWDDAPDSLIEAEAPGHAVNAALLGMGLAAAMRERRSEIDVVVSSALKRHASPCVLGLGAGRAPEIDLFRPGSVSAADRWVIVDEKVDEKMLQRSRANRVEYHRADPAVFLAQAEAERFDVIYLVDALDTLEDEKATALLAAAVGLLAPNGRLLVSSFDPALAGTAYLDALLDWRPILRDEAELRRLLGSIPSRDRLTVSAWRGASNGVAFGVVDRPSWTG